MERISATDAAVAAASLATSTAHTSRALQVGAPATYMDRGDLIHAAVVVHAANNG